MLSTGTARSARSSSYRAPVGAQPALVAWIASRVAVALAALAGTWLVTDAPVASLGSWLTRWNRWDVNIFIEIARFGYRGYPQHYPDQHVIAFFPGFPLLLRAVHAVVPQWVAAGLLISLVAGGVVVVALQRLAVLEGLGAEGGRLAVLALVLSPYAVFLAAGYSESLFLALALPAWLCARQGRWAAAGVLAALAATVRVTGLYLAVALVVELVVSRRGRVLREAGWLLLPFLALFGWVAYLHHLTGDWLAWQHAQAAGWGRSLTNPWTALVTTWHAAGNVHQAAPYAWSFRAELVAMAVGVVLTGWLLVARRWAEATYVGLQVVSFGISSYYLSVARAALLWWPLWLALAGLARRRPWTAHAYAATAPVLMTVEVVAFTSGRWVG